MDNFKPNSNRYKEEQKARANEEKKEVRKVVTGTAKVKKKSEFGKVASIFISEDAKNVGNYVLTDYIVPMVKKAILGAVDMVLNGGSGNYDKRTSNVHKVSYGKYYSDPGADRYERPVRTVTQFNSDDIVFETIRDAEAALDQMGEIIREYGFVTVADLYDMADLTPPAYTSNNYGWSTINTAEPVKVRGGYILKLPKMTPRN